MFGAGVAVTGGVNRLPPVGLMLFSVGDGVAGASEVVVVVVVPWCSTGFPCRRRRTLR